MKLCWNIDWTLPWRFRRKELFHLCLSLAHLLTLCHIEATSRRKGSTRTDPPALQGYHHSPPPSSPLISSAFALWANAELYILGPSLPFFLSFFLSPSLSPEESWKNRSILMLRLWNFIITCCFPTFRNRYFGRVSTWAYLSWVRGRCKTLWFHSTFVYWAKHSHWIVKWVEKLVKYAQKNGYYTHDRFTPRLDLWSQLFLPLFLRYAD